MAGLQIGQVGKQVGWVVLDGGWRNRVKGLVGSIESEIWTSKSLVGDIRTLLISMGMQVEKSVTWHAGRGGGVESHLWCKSL